MAVLKNNRISKKRFILVIFVYIGVLWSWFQYSIAGIFGYWDELFTLLGIVVIVFNSHRWRKCRQANYYVVFFAAYIFAGVVGNIAGGLVSIKAALYDILINIKFPVCLLAAYCIFKPVNIEKYSSIIRIHVEILSIVLIIAYAINLFMDIFPVYEIRFGINSVQLFFAHPSFCAGAVFYLLLLRIVFIKHNNFSTCVSLILLLIIFMTLRFKAIISIFALYVLGFFIYHRRYRQLKLPLYIIAGAIAFAICYDQVSFYFAGYGLHHFPRGVLFLNSFTLMGQFFPFGTGFGSFGSYYSGVYYSPVYKMLGIDDIFGLSYDNYNAITDQYWPMVGGQTGIFGLLFMITAWAVQFIWIEQLRNVNEKYYYAAMGGFMYILISSTSESAICNPVNIPLGLLIGILLSQITIKYQVIGSQLNKQYCFPCY